MNKYTYSLLLLGLLTGIISGIETNVVILQNARTILLHHPPVPFLNIYSKDSMSFYIDTCIIHILRIESLYFDIYLTYLKFRSKVQKDFTF